MRRSLLVLLMAAAPAAAPAQVGKLPPDLRLLLRRGARAAVSAPVAGRGADLLGAMRDMGRGGPFVVTRDASGVTWVDVFVRARRGSDEALRARGAVLGTRSGAWLTARVPLARLRDVAMTPGVTAIQAAHRLTLAVDANMRDIGVDSIRQRAYADLYEGETGRGAIIGIVDTGIDFRHADFLQDDHGRSRVLFLWDQTDGTSGAPPGQVGSSRFDYGRECTREQLGADGTCPERDVVGHGTHVAGIAAGDGSAAARGLTSYAYTGVAPGAELIVVKSDLSETGVVDGVRYVFERAAQLGRPAVVNLSLGTQLGPHDGDEAISLMLDSLTGPGRIIVAAAGNEGNDSPDASAVFPAIHADTQLAVGSSATIEMTIPAYVPAPGSGNDLVLLQGFHDAADTFAISVRRPNGSVLAFGAPSTDTVSNDADGAVVAYRGSIGGDSVLGGLSIGSFAAASASQTIELYLGEWVSGGAAPAAGAWELTVTRTAGSGSGRFDLYIPDNELRAATAFTRGATNRDLVGTPGDARDVITVGAYSTLSDWAAVDGQRYEPQPFDTVPLGAQLRFSSPGPTRDGRLKPEISAPGRVFGALSRSIYAPLPVIATDSAHWVLEGTSMATPHVTGAVALLLARNARLGPAQVRSILTAAARQDQYTTQSFSGDAGAVPNDAWGYGKLDVPAALARVSLGPGRGLADASTVARTLQSSRRGTLIPLQTVRLSASDPESLSVVRLGATVTGNDRAFRLAAVLDANHDGVVDAADPVLGYSDTTALLGEQALHVDLPAGRAVIPEGGTMDVILAGAMSGDAPNGTLFAATLVADSSRTLGQASSITRTLSGLVLPYGETRTTVLAANERVNIAQNPVRTSPLIINFADPATRIAIYDFAGRLVREVQPASGDRAYSWDLTDDGGGPVANGAYILVVDLLSGPVRRTVFVAR